jgi:hypothetical protein
MVELYRKRLTKMGKIQKLSDSDVDMFFLTSSIGICVSLFLIASYILYKKFRKPPGMLIFWELLSMLME